MTSVFKLIRALKVKQKELFVIKKSIIFMQKEKIHTEI